MQCREGTRDVLTLCMNRFESCTCVNSSFFPTQVKNFLSKRVLIMYFFSKVRMCNYSIGNGGKEMKQEMKYRTGFDFWIFSSILASQTALQSAPLNLRVSNSCPRHPPHLSGFLRLGSSRPPESPGCGQLCADMSLFLRSDQIHDDPSWLIVLPKSLWPVWCSEERWLD